MTALKIFTKTPSEILDFYFDFDRELDPLEDTIISSTWTLSDDLTIENEQFEGMKTQAFIGGGILGEQYPVSNLVQTQGGRTYEKGFRIKIEAPSSS